ncbi:MAG TPA: ParB N-terminal domain-containing protein [Anaerolineae bacterium]|nr:ParB N-terminal domain-containing protein [Anaerolineae bacterium]
MTSHQQDLPDLRILPVSSLLLHEQHDAQRSEPLAMRLNTDGVLRNPPIVAPIPDESRFVVLDGANRVTALATLRIPHVVAQVVDYEDEELILDTWYHLVSDLPREDFHRTIDNLPGVTLIAGDLIHARAELARREALAYIVYPGGEVFIVQVTGDLHQRAARLNDIVNIYKARGKIYRANTDHVDKLLPYYDAVTVLVVFPRYQPSEIIELARIGARLPAGITRHVIPRRALRLNFPLAVLRDDWPLIEKNGYLKDWLKRKMANKEARFYQESTFLFDE